MFHAPDLGEVRIKYNICDKKSNFEKPLGAQGVFGWITVKYEVFVVLTMNVSVV